MSNFALLGPNRTSSPAVRNKPRRQTESPGFYPGVAGLGLGVQSEIKPSVPPPRLVPNPDLSRFDASKLVNGLSEAKLRELHADLRCAAIKAPEVYAKLLLDLSDAIRAQYGSSPEGFDLDDSSKALPCDSKPKTCGGALREVLPALDFLCTVTDEETAKAYPLTSDASMALAAGTGALVMQQQARDQGAEFDLRKQAEQAYKLSGGTGGWELGSGSAAVGTDLPSYFASPDFNRYLRAHMPGLIPRVPLALAIPVAAAKDAEPGKLATARAFAPATTSIALINEVGKTYITPSSTAIAMGISAGSQTALAQESSTIVPGPQDKLAADLRVDDQQRIKGGSFNAALNPGAAISERSPWAKQNKLSLGIAGSYLTEDAVPPAAASQPPSQLRLQVPPLAPRRTEWSIGGQFGLFGANAAADYSQRTTPTGLDMRQLRTGLQYSGEHGGHTITFGAAHAYNRWIVDPAAGGDQHTARLGNESGAAHKAKFAADLKLALNSQLNMSLGGVVAVLWKNGEFRGLGEAGGSLGFEGELPGKGSVEVSGAYLRRRFDPIGSLPLVWLNGLQLKLLVDAGNAAPWFISGGFLMIDASWAAQNLGPMETAVPTEIAEVRPGDSGATVVGGVIFTLRPLKKKRRR